jgi:hypothetical protein
LSTAPVPADKLGTILGLAAYWLTVAAVYLLAGVLFFYSGKSKLFDDDGHAPAAVKQQFEGTFVDTFPGIDVLWVIIGVLELSIFALLLLSLRGEFLPRKPKLLLLVGLSLALFTYACLSFGQTTTGNLEGTASLYTYFGSTAIVFMLVLLLPPNSPRNWLSARRANGG